MADNEKQFEIDIETSLTSAEGGWQKATDAGYRAGIQYDTNGCWHYSICEKQCFLGIADRFRYIARKRNCRN